MEPFPLLSVFMCFRSVHRFAGKTLREIHSLPIGLHNSGNTGFAVVYTCLPGYILFALCEVGSFVPLMLIAPAPHNLRNL